MIIAIDTGDMLMLIRVASKAAENDEIIKNALLRNGLLTDAEQMGFDLYQTKRVLADLDRAYPSVVPVPHDGRSWAERVPEEGEASTKESLFARIADGVAFIYDIAEKEQDWEAVKQEAAQLLKDMQA